MSRFASFSVTGWVVTTWIGAVGALILAVLGVDYAAAFAVGFSVGGAIGQCVRIIYVSRRDKGAQL